MGWREITSGATAIRRIALVALVPLVLFVSPARASNDPAFGQLWNMQKIGAPAAWATTTGAGVRVGIVDTGIDLGHPDLAGRIAAAVSCTDNSGDPSHCGGSGQDIFGHGTHVAGIIAADKDNGIGVVGVAPSASLYMARVFHNDPNDSNCQPCANINDIAAGLRWLVQVAHVQVVNLSLGDSGNGLLGTGLFRGQSNLRGPVEEAWQGGAIPVIAAGNNGGTLFGSSSNYGTLDAIVVGASGPNDEAAFYSSDLGNAKWGIVAPGGDASQGCNAQPSQCVLSTWPFDAQGHPASTYAALQGTSMATPHVTGALALLMARGLSRDTAVTTVLGTANKSAAPWCGCSGRLDVAAAVAATGTGPAKPAPTTAPTSPAPVTTGAPRHASSTGGGTAPATTTGPTTGAATGSPAPTDIPSIPPAGAARPGQVAARQLHSSSDHGASGLLELVAVAALLGAVGAVAQTRAAVSRRGLDSR